MTAALHFKSSFIVLVTLKKKTRNTAIFEANKKVAHKERHITRSRKKHSFWLGTERVIGCVGKLDKSHKCIRGESDAIK